MSEEKLSNIRDLLEDIKGLLLLLNQEKIDESKTKILKPGSIEESIYKLCDGTNTTADIMASIQKDQRYSNNVLGILRRKGLIKTIEKNGQKVHEQRF